MALSRKFLKAMGIEDEKIDQIIDAHSETVNALKDEIAEYKDSADKLTSTEKELAKLKKEAEEIEKKGEKDPYKLKYEAMKEDFENFKKEISAKETKANKEKLYSELLKEAGVSEKRIAAVLKVSDLDSIEIEDGKIKDSAKLSKSIQEEWADFIVKTEEKGAKVPNPPSGSGKALTKDEIMSIKDSAERQKAIAENHELFGY
jgi:ribosomal protein L20A (L18A)